MIKEIEVGGRAAWLSQPGGAARGAVVVCHGGGGLSPHERGVIERLAAAGFAAIAPDLLGDASAEQARCLSEAGEKVPDALRAAVMGVIRLVGEPARLRGRVNAAIERARSFGRVAVVGHCFGGTAALEAARGIADVACAVSLHGGLATPEPATAVKARVLACCGAADPFCPPEQRAAFEAEMTRAGAEWQVHVYGGVRHGFTVPGSERTPGCAYDERADRRLWAAMLALFDETLGA